MSSLATDQAAVVTGPEDAPATRVLLVDDEPALLRALEKILGRAGNTVVVATNGVEAIARMDAGGEFDVVVSDIRMPAMDGLTLLRAIRARDLDLPVVFLTGSPSLETAVEAVEHGAFRYLTKPIDSAHLTSTVARAAQVRRLALVRRDVVTADGARGIGDLAGLNARWESGVEKMWMAMQPILSWRVRNVFAYEALLRTDEPSLRNPTDFLDAAERLERTAELGRLIRRLVAEQMVHLPTNVKIFVNVLPSDLVDDELCSQDGALTPYAHGVVLEVTERAALDRVPGLFAAVRRLRQLGYTLALDDLGAGYAGLSSFALLEPEVVKVDMSLVRGIHASATKQKLFRAFASVCRDLNAELVAEGVETAEERDCLTSLGGDLYQGYLFARPGRGFPAPAY